MHASVEEALEMIDAAFFSGDCFHDRQNLDHAKEYLDRWNREVEVIEKQLALDDQEPQGFIMDDTHDDYSDFKDE
jgi:hypothetical protein